MPLPSARVSADPERTEPARSTEPPPIALRGERLAGIVLARSGPLAAGLVAATALLAAVLVPFGGWHPLVVWPLLLAAGAGLVALVARVPAAPAPRWSAVLCVAIAAGHGWWAAVTHAEHLVLRRDAGSYALYTQWIATRHGLPVPSGLEAFGGPAALTDPAFRLASPAFFQVVHGAPGAAGTSVDIVPQFLIGAPAVFSLGWWTAGWPGLLVTPAIVSALALLAVAGLATRLIGPRWAVLVVAALALAQPILHAARSTYSEPPALLLVAVAAALLVDAVRAGNTTGRGSPVAPGVAPGGASGGVLGRAGGQEARWLGLAAGLAFGLAGLVRVDAVREVAFVFPVAAVLALRGHPAARSLVIGSLAGILVAAVPAVLMSRPYLGEVAASLLPLVAGAVLLGLLSLAVVRVGRRRAARGPAVSGNSARRWSRLAAGSVLLVGVVLASRPLWLVTRQDPKDPGSRVVAGLQLRQGLPIDGGRTYAEYSLTWVSWYLGPIAVIAAWLMLAGLAGQAVRWWLRSGRSNLTGPAGSAGSAGARPRVDVPSWLGPAVIGLAGTVLTLYRPGITPDHPWADRRLVPVVLPVMVIAAGAAAAWVGRTARRRWPASLLLAVLAVATLAMLLPPWLTTAPVAGQRTERGEPVAVQQVCDRLAPGDVVLAVDGRAANEWPQVVRGVCGRPMASIRVAEPAEAPAAIRRIAARIAATGNRPVLLAATPEGAATLTGLALEPALVANLDTVEDQHLLTRVPDGGDRLAVQVWLARGPVPGTG